MVQTRAIEANTTIVNGGRYDRWGHTGELHKRMAHYRGSDLPYYYALASAFTLCDAYHCSTLTQTYPELGCISGPAAHRGRQGLWQATRR